MRPLQECPVCLAGHLRGVRGRPSALVATTAIPRCCWGGALPYRNSELCRHCSLDLPTCGRDWYGCGQGRPDASVLNRSMACTPFQPCRGAFGICRGPLLAATDSIEIKIEGRGGHAGMLHASIDTILVGARLLVALQRVFAQNVDPLDCRGFTL